MIKILFAVLLCSFASFGAVTTNSVWEVWTTGAPTNGGCFDPSVSVPGTDYSQQTGPQVSFTDLLIGVTETQATSILNPITDAMVGNCVSVAASAGCTAQFVVLLSQTGGTGTFSTDLGTAASACTAKLGGALTTLTGPAVVAGNTVYVKATATYGITATQTFSVNGTAVNPITFIGYTSTRTDGGQVTVQRSSGNLTLFSVTGAFRKFYNFIADGAGTGTQTCFSHTATNVTFVNCKAMGFTANGFVVGGGGSFVTYQNCYATGGTSAATAAFNVGAASLVGVRYFSSEAIGNACPGFLHQSTSSSAMTSYVRCIAANNTNSADGFKTTNGQISLTNCVSYGNAGAGLLVDTGTTATAGDSLQVLNSIFVNNTGVGISSNTTNYTLSRLSLDYNAFFGNSSPRNNFGAGAHDITLTGDPFTSSSVFTLNGTAGAGAAAKGVGFPGALQSGGTGSLDVGALQSSGSGGQRGYTRIARSGKPVLVDPAMYELTHPRFEAGISWPFPVWQTIGTLAIAIAGIGLKCRR